MNILRRVFNSLCKPDTHFDAHVPVRPRVTPDADCAAELQRRIDAAKERAPKHDGFMPLPKVRERAIVTQIRKRG